MKRVTKIAIGVATALSLGLATAVVSAHPQGYGAGWGMGQGPGYGPGAGMGSGQGYGPGPGMGQGPGYGPGAGIGQGLGFGPGPGMGRGMGPGGGPGSMGYGPMGRGMGPQVNFNPSAMADARSAYFKSELKITPAQESAWKAFADQRKQQVEAMLALRATVQGGAKATAPERLDLHNQNAKKRQEQMEKMTTAFKDLYAVLTTEQKALADQRVGFGMMGGRGMAFNRPGR